MNDAQIAVLGIDAAWTEYNPSGVALLRNTRGRWQCVAVAPSYNSYIALAKGAEVDWSCVPGGSPLDASDVLGASESLLGQGTVDLIAVDMPIATVPVTGRRAADQDISKCFGAQGCAVHSPTPIRPGPVSEYFFRQFNQLGFRLATAEAIAGQLRSMIEVYPHPALLRLLNASYRICYKKGTTKERLRGLMRIKDGLSQQIDGINLQLPESTSGKSLKRFEDALDALVCAWVASRFVEGCAVAHGDSTAAIWVPK